MFRLCERVQPRLNRPRRQAGTRLEPTSENPNFPISKKLRVFLRPSALKSQSLPSKEYAVAV
jgi:hypothetical protein